MKDPEFGRGNSINSLIVAESEATGLSSNTANNIATAHPIIAMERLFIFESNVEVLSHLPESEASIVV